MALIDLERRVTSLCLGGEPSPEQLAQIGSPDEAKIWLLYRELIRKRLRGELSAALRRSVQAAPSAIDTAFEQWMAGAPPRSRPFCGIIAEFARFAAPRLSAMPNAPAHLADLVAFEAALWDVADLDDRVSVEVVELELDARPVLTPALRLLQLAYAVHEAPAADGSVRAAPTYLCLYRRPEEKSARVLTLNAVAHALMLRIEAGTDATLTESVQRVCAERKLTLDAEFLDRLCTLLADFAERGVLLGSLGA